MSLREESRKGLVEHAKQGFDGLKEALWMTQRGTLRNTWLPYPQKKRAHPRKDMLFLAPLTNK